MADEPESTNQQPPAVIRLAALFEGALAGLACVLGVIFKSPPWQRITWQPAALGLGLIATLPLLVGLLAIRHVRRGPLGRLNGIVDNLLVPLFGGCGIVELALISLAAGFAEEFMFRGLVQPLLIGWLGIYAGIFLASLVFGLLHALTVSYAVLATVVGIYLGWLELTTGNLLTPMVTHSLYDFVALVYLMRTQAQRANAAPETEI